ELAFRLELSAGVLVDEDVAFLRELVVRPDDGAVGLRAVRADAVRRSRQQDRVAFRGALRGIDDREELRAVAHRNRHLALDVVRSDVLGLSRLPRAPRPQGGDVCGRHDDTKAQRKSSSKAVFVFWWLGGGPRGRKIRHRITFGVTWSGAR